MRLLTGTELEEVSGGAGVGDAFNIDPTTQPTNVVEDPVIGGVEKFGTFLDFNGQGLLFIPK